MSASAVAIGMRVKTGRATAVLLAGTRGAPLVLERRALELYDPKVPHSDQPYHVALEMDAAKAGPIIERATEAVRAVALRELTALRRAVEGSGHELRALGLVVGSLGDPAKLGNPHVRAHALEGRLFWEVLDRAAHELGTPCTVVAEKELYAHAAAALGKKPDTLRAALGLLGKSVGRPWGAEEKCAALVAWSALA